MVLASPPVSDPLLNREGKEGRNEERRRGEEREGERGKKGREGKRREGGKQTMGQRSSKLLCGFKLCCHDDIFSGHTMHA